MNDVIENAMTALINKSCETVDAGDAMKFSQAVLNLSHVQSTHAAIEYQKNK